MNNVGRFLGAALTLLVTSLIAPVTISFAKRVFEGGFRRSHMDKRFSFVSTLLAIWRSLSISINS